MKIEFVTHCLNYSRLLAYQLTSFAKATILFPLEVFVTICYTEEDKLTREVVRYFTNLPNLPMTNLNWKLMPMSRERLCRRAIGRNVAALQTKADWIWFVDCDYCFGNKMFEALGTTLDNVPQKNVLVFPQTILSCSKKFGVSLIEEACGELPRFTSLLPLWAFTEQTIRRAIGGLQIVRGDWALVHGYCKNYKKYQEPSLEWAPNFDDVQFRLDVGNDGYKISLPEVYRIRHEKLQKGVY